MILNRLFLVVFDDGVVQDFVTTGNDAVTAISLDDAETTAGMLSCVAMVLLVLSLMTIL